MAKSIGKPLVPEWIAYPIFLVVVTCFMVAGAMAGLALQLLCFVFQPKTIWPSLQEAKDVIVDIFHDLRN